ncbi:unnamed protein product [Ectocarpus sp. 13 AM-2016]
MLGSFHLRTHGFKVSEVRRNVFSTGKSCTSSPWRESSRLDLHTQKDQPNTLSVTRPV